MSRRRSIFAFLAALLLACALASSGFGAAQLPPKPDRYFTDRAGIIDATTGARLNHELANFERETSDQLIVAIFQKVPDGFDRDGFTVEAAHAWGIGRHEHNNGAVLFVFVEDRYVRIEVGYGLEPVLTDATCATIIRNDIVPAFRRSDYAAGINAAVRDMMLACRGEFKGTGKTVGEAHSSDGASNWFVGIFVLILLFFGWLSRRTRGRTYGNGWNRGGGGGWFIGGGGFDSGGGGSSSNDSFSGGGGDFGGGGAGGNW